MKATASVFILFALALASPIARCQTAPAASSPPADTLRIFLVTFGPGADPWEKFGHDAIVVRDESNGDATAYNWGVFNFGHGLSGLAHFGWHFLQGRLMYSMESQPADEMLQAYQEAGRSILIQELNLTSVQKLKLQARLLINDTDANRYYLYDYFQKNCATMTRDAIDQTVDGRVHAALKDLPTPTTYRWHDRRTTADTIWLYLFIDFALGHPVDRPLSQWQESFLPGKLAEHLISVNVPNAQGKWVPLIIDSRQISTGSFAERQTPPASYFYGFLATGVLVGAFIAALAWMGQRNRWFRWAFNLSAMMWSLFAGALGGLLTFALFTNHEAAKWNENWFYMNPISLLLIVLVPAAGRWPKAAKRVAFTIVGICVLALLAKVTPWARQVNGSIIVIALPIHAAVAFGIVRPIQRPTPSNPVSG